MANTLDVFKKFYSELTAILPMIITSLVTKFYSTKLLSGDQKSNIDSLATGKEKTMYFLDEVIKPSLEIKYTILFDEMLKIMESIDNPTVRYLVDEINKFDKSLSPSPPIQATQSKGESKGNNCGIE